MRKLKNEILASLRIWYFAISIVCDLIEPWLQRQLPQSRGDGVEFDGVQGQQPVEYGVGVVPTAQGSKSLARIVWIDQSQYKFEYHITHSSIVIGQFKASQGFRTLITKLYVKQLYVRFWSEPCRITIMTKVSKG